MKIEHELMYFQKSDFENFGRNPTKPFCNGRLHIIYINMLRVNSTKTIIHKKKFTSPASKYLCGLI